MAFCTANVCLTQSGHGLLKDVEQRLQSFGKKLAND